MDQTRRPQPPSASRVDLRPPTPADRDAFLAAMRSSVGLHQPWLSAPVTAEAFDRWLARVQDERFEPMLACRMYDGEIVGYFNINEIVRGALQGGFLAYGAVQAHAGVGYMTEGLGLVLDRAFTDLRLHRLEANIQPRNSASISLVRRAGFVKEGFSKRYLKIGERWRDHERWAIRAEQWRPVHPAPE